MKDSKLHSVTKEKHNSKKDVNNFNIFRTDPKRKISDSTCNFEYYKEKEKAIVVDSSKVKNKLLSSIDLNKNTENKLASSIEFKTKKNRKSSKDLAHVKRIESKSLNHKSKRKKTEDGIHSSMSEILFKGPVYKVSAKCNQNRIHRTYMEDFLLVENPLNKDSSKALFCVFDGHGGKETAEFCSKKFTEIFSKNLTENPFELESVFTKTFEDIDEQFKKKKIKSVGNTATCVYIVGRNLYCANVGDSTCILIYDQNHFLNYDAKISSCNNFFSKTDFNRNVLQISYDHKCNDEAEANRISKEGGNILDDRINGILAVSRALGDLDLKSEGLSCVPHFYKTYIDSNLLFCVLASDGVWDVLSKDTVYDICVENSDKDVDVICGMIIDKALQKGSEDNISCIVIQLGKEGQ